jgi:hypothetical protein
VARPPNYGFDKRRKEQARKAKQEEKRLRKIDAAKDSLEAPDTAAPDAGRNPGEVTPPGADA